MMGHHLNQMRQEALSAGGAIQYVRVGVVSGYNPDSYCAKVMLQPDGIETGWLPIGAISIGNGFGIQAAPNLGDQAIVFLKEGNLDAGMVGAFMFSDDERPVSLPSGQMLLKHQDGTLIQFNGSGKLTINATTELDITAPIVSVTATTSASVTAPIINLGAFGQTLRAFVTDLFVTLFNGHTHPTGSPNTGTPNQTMSGAHTSSTVKGG